MKKLLMSLGACAVAVAVGLGALLTTKENNNIAKADSEISLNNVVLYTSGERDYSDLPLSQSIYWFNGDLVGVDNSRYDQILINASSGAITRIKLRDYNDSENMITLYNDQVVDSSVLQKVYLLQGSIKNLVFGPIGNPTLIDDSNEIHQYLRYSFDVSLKSDKPWFNFNNQINYNAPYNASLSADYITDTSFNNAGVHIEKSLFGDSYNFDCWFKVSGQYFNDISLTYVSALATSFDDSGEPVASTGFGYYSFMAFSNSITNKMLVVNTRNYSSYTKGNAQGIYFIRSSDWASGSYKNLELLFTPTSEQLSILNTLNNDSNIPNQTYSKEDIGLGGAFTLLGQAFSSVAGLLAIQVLPNITLGLLLFLPLIVGIIIAIIWIVKR